MTRGELLETVTLLFHAEGRLHAGTGVSGNALVTIRGGPRHTIYADGVPLHTTGEGDERAIPDDYAHRVIAELRTARNAKPDLDAEMVEYMAYTKGRP